MFSRRALYLSIFLLLIATLPQISNAQRGKGMHSKADGQRFGMNRETQEHAQAGEFIGQCLEDAGQALSETQKTAIEDLERGPGFREKLLEILDADQIAALDAAKNNKRPGKGMKRKGGNPIAHMAQVLNTAGHTLSETQITEIKAIERGPEAREQIHTILTTEQIAVLEEAHDAKRAEHREKLETTLNDAGAPLTDTQIADIEAIEEESKHRKAIHSILTDEQNEILKAGHKGKGMKRKGGHRAGAFKALKKAGHPLTDEQRDAIKALPRGPEHREAIDAILTDEQKEVLWAAKGAGDSDEIEGAEKISSNESQPVEINILKQNFPNPFNPSTTLDYRLSTAGNIKIEVYSPSGQLITTLIDSYQSAGSHSVVWDASGQAAGVYICKLISGNSSITQKMTLMK